MKILRGSISIISLIIFLFSLFPLPNYSKKVTDIKEIFNIQSIGLLRRLMKNSRLLAMTSNGLP